MPRHGFWLRFPEIDDGRVEILQSGEEEQPREY
jgi:hypothetical protein